SNEPFHSINEMTASVNAFLRIPQGEHNAWLFSLMYSPTNELNFPIPGIAYLWAPSEKFQAVLGIPFALNYRPIENLTLSFNYVPVRNLRARATYRLASRLRIYTGFEWSNQSYFPVPRPDDQDRLFYYDKRVLAGVQLPLGEHLALDV